MKVEFFNHRTLGQSAKVTTRTLTLFYVLDGIWRDADSVEAVVLTKVPETEWARDGWFGIAKRQTAAEL